MRLSRIRGKKWKVVVINEAKTDSIIITNRRVESQEAKGIEETYVAKYLGAHLETNH